MVSLRRGIKPRNKTECFPHNCISAACYMVIAAFLAVQVVLMMIVLSSTNSAISKEQHEDMIISNTNAVVSKRTVNGNAKKARPAPVDVYAGFHRLISNDNQKRFVGLLKSNESARGKNESQNIPGRIGILTQPGLIGDAFFDIIQILLQTLPVTSMKHELIHTSRAPPYGYGKNHGYDKFIRLVTLPIELAFVDAEYSFKDHLLSTPSTTSFTSVSRQFVRWHCRLSHASAHTPLYTVLVPELVDDSISSFRKTMQFILKGSKVESIAEDMLFKTAFSFDNKFQSIIDSESFTKNSLFANMNIENVNKVFVEEFDKTNNLKAWPCLALWDVQDATLDDNKSQMNLPSLLASSMVPDCSSSYSSCFVQRDLCEHKGKVC